MTEERKASAVKETPWSQYQNRKTDQVYFVNAASGRSAWVPPKDQWFKAILFKVGKKKVGRVFYYNPYLHKTTLVQPMDYDHSLENFKYPVILKPKQKYLRNDDFVPCYETTTHRVYWYNPSSGVRTWHKPSSCKHKYKSYIYERDFTDISAQQEKIMADYRTARTRFDKLAKKLEQLKLEVTRKQTKIENLRSNMNKQVKRKRHHHSMNMMASAVRMAFSRRGETDVQSSFSSSSKDYAYIISFMKSIDLFLYLHDKQFQSIAAHVQRKEFFPGQRICTSQTHADVLFIIEQGTVGVYADSKTAEYLQLDTLPMEANEDDFGQKVAQLYAGEYIGAKQILTGKAYEFDHIALSPTHVYTLTKPSFDSIVMRSKYEKLVFTYETRLKEQYSTARKLQKTKGVKTIRAIVKTSKDLVKTTVDHIKDTLIESHEIQHKSNQVELSSLTNYITACSNLVALKVSHAKSKELTRALFKLTLSFSPFLNYVDLLTRTVHTVKEIFKTNEVNLFKIQDLGDSQGALALLDDIQVKHNNIIGLDDGLVAKAINLNALVSATNHTYREHINSDKVLRKYNDVNAVMVCPICNVNNEVVGAIRVMRTKINSEFSEVEQRIMVAIAEQVSHVFEGKLLKPEVCSSIREIKNYTHPIRLSCKKFVGSLFEEMSTSAKAREILVRAGLYNGDQQLCQPWFMQSGSEQKMITFAKFDRNFDLNISYSDLPRTAYLVFEIFVVDLVVQDLQLRRLAKRSGTVRDFFTKFASNEEDTVNTASVKDKVIFANSLKHLRQSNFPFLSDDGRMYFQKAIFEEAMPKGWTAMGLFDFEQLLAVGNFNLKLIDTKAFDPKELLFNPILDTKIMDRDKTSGLFEIEVHKPVFSSSSLVDENYDHFLYSDFGERKKHVSKRRGEPLNVNLRNRQLLVKHVYADPLNTLDDKDKEFIYSNRDALIHDPHALPRFIESVNFARRRSVLEMYEYLNWWKVPDPVVALNLLGPTSVDYKVRSLAVTGLASMSDKTLATYVVQLVQCLRFERFLDNALACYLIAKSIENPWLLGVSFYWAVTTEISKLLDESQGSEINGKLILRYRTYKALYLKHCRNRVELGHQRYVNRKLLEVHIKLSNFKDVKEKGGYLKTELAKIHFPAKFRLPTNNKIWCTGINLDGCSVKSSKKLPFYLSFNTERDAETLDVIYKFGDDLRQDQLTLTAFSVVDSIWKQHAMDMRLSIYRVVATSNATGYIEVVKDSKTIATIQIGEKKYNNKVFSQLRTAFAATKKARMKNLFQDDEDNVRNNFIPSCAGYCVLTYILGIGDRHNDNMMMTNDLKLFHIDFGHFLGNFKKAFKIIPRETAPFVLTQQMVSLMQAVQLFGEFKLQFVKAFQVLRQPKNGNLLMTLFKIMISSDITELKQEKDILWIRHKLMVDKPENEAVNEMEALIQSASAKFSTYFNHLTHIVKHHKNY